MIQRIQTVFLLLCVLTQACLLFFPVAKEKAESVGPVKRYYVTKISVVLKKDNKETTAEAATTLNTMMNGLTIFIGLAALVNIFMFRNRKRQLSLIKALLVFVVGFIGCLIFYVFFSEEKSLSMQPALFLPLLSFIFLLLAANGIMKDEELVQSADRLR